MVEQVISKVLMEMMGKGIDELKAVLYCVLSGYDISEKSTELQSVDESWKEELGAFLVRKRVEGRSDGTIEQYNLHLSRMLRYINKPAKEITESDLFMYISMYKKQRNVSSVYLDNIRLVFSSFFGWLNNKGYIAKNPAAGLDPIKAEKRIKKPLSDTELETLRRKCVIKRDIALIEFLYSTGVRASELIALNRQDIDFNSMDAVVYGKGAKERETYLNAAACMHLKEYLNTRTDGNEALFVSLKAPHDRLTVSGVEEILRRLGKATGIEKVHPHRFRRTMATNILNKGMPIEEVKEILGHAKLDTTLIYCQVNKENVKHHHRKYMSA
ncbi:site-specific tyrosine recombinase/integron integrase [Parablautia muri]|uniref:Integrase n=1 Tax=Parablautia muri TaxID=2320879 RepID=A0A9X5BKY9_9FIRM|nr:site-specific tyrosine recombinase/integron integrase [Parablautia muri]NBJ95639.1 integrase [Parablautia muri]